MTLGPEAMSSDLSVVDRDASVVSGKAAPMGAAATVAAMVGLTWGPSTIAIMGLGVFIRPLQADFGWTRAQVALVATVINLVVVVMSPIQGLLIDRFGSRRVVIPSLFIFSTGLMLLYLLPPKIDVFYLSWGMLVAVSVGLLPASFLRVVSGWFDGRLGLAMGVANSGIGLGNIIVPLVAAYVIATHGWRMAYVTLGLMVLCIVTPVCVVWLREHEASSPESGAQKEAREHAKSSSFRLAVQGFPFWVLMTAFFLLGLVNTALITQQVPMLIDAGVTPQKAAFVQSMFGVALLVGRLGTGFLLDHIFAPIVMIVVTLGAALACLIYSAGPSGGIVWLPAALIGLVVGAEFDVLGYTIKRYFGVAAFGKIYGLIFAIFQLGAALGAAAFALAHDAYGSYAMGLYGAALALTLACLTFASLPGYPVALPSATTRPSARSS
jgi:predicted MFS family arabinose efflux permease